MTISVGECRSPGGFSHDLLLHDGESAVVPGTLAFVQEGLASGGEVLVHGTEDRVAMLLEILGTHPRLTYGLDRDLYQSPMATLFRYQRALMDSREPAGLWATGTVPVHGDGETQAAWARYESLVDEALSPYTFHGLCTYDTRALPEHVIGRPRRRTPTSTYRDGRLRAPPTSSRPPSWPTRWPVLLNLPPSSPPCRCR